MHTLVAVFPLAPSPALLLRVVARVARSRMHPCSPFVFLFFRVPADLFFFFFFFLFTCDFFFVVSEYARFRLIGSPTASAGRVLHGRDRRVDTVVGLPMALPRRSSSNNLFEAGAVQ